MVQCRCRNKDKRYTTVPGRYHLSKKVCGLAAGVFFFILTACYADARDFFSKQYGLPCTQCHTKIPNLTEFGVNFKNNGYSLEKREVKPAPPPAGGAAAVADPHVSPKENTQESADEKGKDTALGMPPPPPPPPPDKTEYLYKWQSEDGTSVFTDNPLRLIEERSARKKGKSAGTSPNSRRRGVAKSASNQSGLPQEKSNKNVIDSAGTPIKTTSASLENTPEYQISTVKTQPRNYDECMGTVLINNVQPKNVKEIMELFEMAERSCAPYATPR
jgi:hypothetical protein